jgi:hypothetical protein
VLVEPVVALFELGNVLLEIRYCFAVTVLCLGVRLELGLQVLNVCLIEEISFPSEWLELKAYLARRVPLSELCKSDPQLRDVSLAGGQLLSALRQL